MFKEHLFIFLLTVKFSERYKKLLMLTMKRTTETYANVE